MSFAILHFNFLNHLLNIAMMVAALDSAWRDRGTGNNLQLLLTSRPLHLRLSVGVFSQNNIFSQNQTRKSKLAGLDNTKYF